MRKEVLNEEKQSLNYSSSDILKKQKKTKKKEKK
jgi:hypothetical protein